MPSSWPSPSSRPSTSKRACSTIRNILAELFRFMWPCLVESWRRRLPISSHSLAQLCNCRTSDKVWEELTTILKIWPLLYLETYKLSYSAIHSIQVESNHPKLWHSHRSSSLWLWNIRMDLAGANRAHLKNGIRLALSDRFTRHLGRSDPPPQQKRERIKSRSTWRREKKKSRNQMLKNSIEFFFNLAFNKLHCIKQHNVSKVLYCYEI